MTRIKKLDGLRGLFCMMVVLYHYDQKYLPSFVYNNFLIRESDLIVDFFFILSGFVISYKYNAIETFNSFYTFIKKRFIRLYPLLLYTTFLFFIFELVARLFFKQYINSPITLLHLFQNTLDTLCMTNSTPILSSEWGINRPSWSISAEFISYLFFGIISIVAARKRKDWMMLLIFLLSIFASIYFDSLGLRTNANIGFIRCLISFSVGYFIFKLSSVDYKINNWMEPLLVFTIMILLYLNHYFFKLYSFSLYFEVLILPIVFGYTIFSLLKTDGFISRLLEGNFFQFLGKISFSIYLNHAIVLLFLPKFIFAVTKMTKSNFNELAVWITTIFVVIIYSTITQKYIEQKSSAFLKKYLL